MITCFRNPHRLSQICRLNEERARNTLLNSRSRADHVQSSVEKLRTVLNKNGQPMGRATVPELAARLALGSRINRALTRSECGLKEANLLESQATEKFLIAKRTSKISMRRLKKRTLIKEMQSNSQISQFRFRNKRQKFVKLIGIKS